MKVPKSCTQFNIISRKYSVNVSYNTKLMNNVIEKLYISAHFCQIFTLFFKFILLNVMTLNLVSFSSIIIYLQSKAPKYYNLNHLIELPEMKITSSLSLSLHTHTYTHSYFFILIIIRIPTSCSEKVHEFWYQKANSRPLYI